MPIAHYKNSNMPAPFTATTYIPGTQDLGDILVGATGIGGSDYAPIPSDLGLVAQLMLKPEIVRQLTPESIMNIFGSMETMQKYLQNPQGTLVKSLRIPVSMWDGADSPGFEDYLRKEGYQQVKYPLSVHPLASFAKPNTIGMKIDTTLDLVRSLLQYQQPQQQPEKVQQPISPTVPQTFQSYLTNLPLPSINPNDYLGSSFGELNSFKYNPYIGIESPREKALFPTISGTSNLYNLLGG